MTNVRSKMKNMLDRIDKLDTAEENTSELEKPSNITPKILREKKLYIKRAHISELWNNFKQPIIDVIGISKSKERDEGEKNIKRYNYNQEISIDPQIQELQ